MDLATIGGWVGGLVLILGSVIVVGNDVSRLWDLASFLIVIFGSFAAVVASNPLSRGLGLFRLFKHVLNVTEYNQRELIDQLVQFADSARKEGLLSLDDSLNEVEDDFLKSGLRLVVDGTDPDIIKGILRVEVSQIESRHETNISMIESWASIAPAFGMIGTLLGLIAMMANLEDTASVGPNMAVALITTLYGSLFANLFITPIGKKLEDRNKDEMLVMEMMMQGIISIQAGDNPNLLKEKLEKFLPPSERDAAEDIGE